MTQAARVHGGGTIVAGVPVPVQRAKRLVAETWVATRSVPRQVSVASSPLCNEITGPTAYAAIAPAATTTTTRNPVISKRFTVVAPRPSGPNTQCPTPDQRPIGYDASLMFCQDSEVDTRQAIKAIRRGRRLPQFVNIVDSWVPGVGPRPDGVGEPYLALRYDTPSLTNSWHAVNSIEAEFAPPDTLQDGCPHLPPRGATRA